MLEQLSGGKFKVKGEKERAMEAIVLAAGKGIRLNPITYTRPKHLIPIGGRPILERLLLSIRDAGLRRIILVVHYKADMIKEYFRDGKSLGLDIEYVYQPELRGTADAVGVTEEHVSDDEFLIINGDLLVSTDAIRKVLRSYREKSNAHLTVVHVDHPERYGVVKIKDSRIIDIMEKPRPEVARNYPINAGIYIFNREIFRAVKKTKVSPRGEREITDSIRLLIREGTRISPIQINRREWMDIGRPQDLLEANRRVMNGLEPSIEGSIEDDVQLIGSVVIAEGARIGSGSRIEGPVIIGEDSDIGSNCYIRAFSSIGREVKIGCSCKVGNSIIMDETDIRGSSHIEDCVIGRGCTFGSGTLTMNKRLSSIHLEEPIRGIRKNLDREASGVFVGDYVRTGEKVILMPGVRIGCNSSIGPYMIVSENVPSDTVLEMK